MILTELVVKKLNTPGRYSDDQTKGLHLWVKPNRRKYWIHRVTIKGKRIEISHGPSPEIGIKLARERAIEVRNALNKGINPLEGRRAASKEAEHVNSILFNQFALDYIGTMRPKWSSDKHAGQWVSTITTYAFPIIGEIPIEEVDTPHILQILQPIWLTKPETASRVRGRLELILSAAITRKLRPALNPATWKGHLATLLPPPPRKDKHHEALPYGELPKLMAELKESDGISALALEFTILNASRTNEVLAGLRDEVNGTLWTIPGKRMKAKRDHCVPLCQRSLELLSMAKSQDLKSAYLFSRNGKRLSSMSMLMAIRRLRPGITVHGFRSTFRDWVSEETDHSPEVAEMALAHTIENKVEAAYRRGNLLERRRRLMQDWENYCLGSPASNVILFNSLKTA